MKNKLQPPGKIIKIVMVLAIVYFLPDGITAQVNTNDSSFILKKQNKEELKAKQRGSELVFSFPKLQFKSALKFINLYGSVMKAIMVDEGIQAISADIGNLPKGMYECVLENRKQRFTKKILLQ